MWEALRLLGDLFMGIDSGDLVKGVRLPLSPEGVEDPSKNDRGVDVFIMHLHEVRHLHAWGWLVTLLALTAYISTSKSVPG